MEMVLQMSRMWSGNYKKSSTQDRKVPAMIPRIAMAILSSTSVIRSGWSRTSSPTARLRRVPSHSVGMPVNLRIAKSTTAA